MPPRRSHKKSRAGCRRCKARKIKCDEVHPKCGLCVKHGVPCDFESPEIADRLQAALAASSPNVSTPSEAGDASPESSAASPVTTLCRPPPAPIRSSTTAETSRLLELRLLHQYTTKTSKTLSFSGPSSEGIWRDTVPHVAFAGSPHLTDAVLAVAALHLRSLSPDDKELVRASHAYMASSLREYSEALKRGISGSNAEALFLTSTLIAFQSTATRIFSKDESGPINARDSSLAKGRGVPGAYSVPLSWFHAFQGVKAVTAAAWPWIRHSGIVIPIIDAQPVLQLEFSTTQPSFFGHLLEGLDAEMAALATPLGDERTSAAAPRAPSAAHSTKQAYEHAVAVLNWAHKIPHKGAPLAFPATVSRRYVELLEERKPRALAILACFFALLKPFGSRVWWLEGMARREVLGVVSLFNSDFFGAEVERQWWPHLQWAVRVALYDDSGNPGYVPADVWGAAWLDDDTVLAQRGSQSFVSHIEMLSKLDSALKSFPAPDDQG